jgi:MFS family permease
MKHNVYRKYLLTVLLTIMAFNSVDRLALGLLLQDIKADLALSDTQLGLLSGMAFALFYSTMGIPIARWADRGNRVTIITITTALWSVAVALCGIAGNFVHLLLIRVGVAVGESGCVPPAHSLIGDYFNRAERPKAVGIYKLGTPLSGIIGFFGAGWLNELYGWRITFMLLGLPGVGLALLAWLTLREPRRQPASGSLTDASLRRKCRTNCPAQPSITEVCTTLWKTVSFRHLLLAYSVAYFFGAGIGQWTPSFFVRSYGLRSSELGAWFAVISGVSGLAGTYLGGAWASRYACYNERLQIRAMAVMYCGCVVIWVLQYLSPSPYLAFAFMGVGSLGGSMISGPLFATIQTLVPTRMRAMAIALVLLFANLIGLGLGPLATGLLSDWFAARAGPESLRYALLMLCPGFLWCALHLWIASRSVTADVAVLEALREDAARTQTQPLSTAREYWPENDGQSRSRRLM